MRELSACVRKSHLQPKQGSCSIFCNWGSERISLKSKKQCSNQQFFCIFLMKQAPFHVGNEDILLGPQPFLCLGRHGLHNFQGDVHAFEVF